MLNREILHLTQAYLAQQAELYGTEFYVDGPIETPPGTAPDPARALQAFAEKIRDCTRCTLSEHRTQVVFGVGDPQADLMCVGEGPGYEEDRQGEPFVGPAGQLLNRILASIGFDRQEVYIANIVKCRPPNNRDPEPEEAAECLPYLRKQIGLIQPSVILALGKVAAQSLLGSDASVAALRGRVHDFDGVPVVVTYHPAALLRNTGLKRRTWEDVQRVRKLYDERAGNKPLLQTN